MGVVVDSVSEVINIRQNDIEETPNFGTHIETDYILGMAKTNGGVKILLDIDRVMSEAELRPWRKSCSLNFNHSHLISRGIS